MKIPTPLLRLGTLFCAVLLLLAGPVLSQAQTRPEPEAAAAAAPERDIQTELLQAYIRLQAQLNDAQLAIEKSRADSEKSAREQAAAITDKLAAIQTALTALDADRARQQKEFEQFNRTVLWVAGIFGCAGMLAMLVTALFQWRTMNSIAEISTWRPQLAAGSPTPLLPAGTDLSGGKVVELSNQRLMSVIERLERRVFELEHTAATPKPDASADGAQEPTEGQGNSGRIALLLAKGQALLNEDQADKALECYDAILELDPRHSEALVKKGAALERLKQDEEALRCYDRAIEADRTLTIAYLYKGGVYNRLERYHEALECYEQALKTQGQPA